MKLTKIQRYTAYCIMLDLIEKKDEYFFCTCLKHFGIDMSHYNIEMFFPELWAKRPKINDYAGSWYITIIPNRKRIKVLKQCIIETHP